MGVNNAWSGKVCRSVMRFGRTELTFVDLFLFFAKDVKAQWMFHPLYDLAGFIGAGFDNGQEWPKYFFRK